MPETPPENSHLPLLRPPSPRHRRNTPRLPADEIQQKVHDVIRQPLDDRLNEKELRAVKGALGGMRFEGQNPSFNNYDGQSQFERGNAIGTVEQENSDWINTAFAAVPNARWIKVENGSVTAGGGSDTMPDDIDVYEEGKRKGVVPFVFRLQEDQEGTETKYYSDYRREQIKCPHVVDDLPKFVEIVCQLNPGGSALFISRNGYDTGTQVRNHNEPCKPNHDSFGDHMELFLEEQTGKKVTIANQIMDGRVTADGFEHDLDSFGYLVTVVE